MPWWILNTCIFIWWVWLAEVRWKVHLALVSVPWQQLWVSACTRVLEQGRFMWHILFSFLSLQFSSLQRYFGSALSFSNLQWNSCHMPVQPLNHYKLISTQNILSPGVWRPLLLFLQNLASTRLIWCLLSSFVGRGNEQLISHVIHDYVNFCPTSPSFFSKQKNPSLLNFSLSSSFSILFDHAWCPSVNLFHFYRIVFQTGGNRAAGITWQLNVLWIWIVT